MSGLRMSVVCRLGCAPHGTKYLAVEWSDIDRHSSQHAKPHQISDQLLPHDPP